MAPFAAAISVSSFEEICGGVPSASKPVSSLSIELEMLFAPPDAVSIILIPESHIATHAADFGSRQGGAL